MEQTSDRYRDEIIQIARYLVDYWTNEVGDMSCEKRISGVMFSFLAELDGCGGLPPCDIIVWHHDEDGNKVGETRVSTMLHEYFYERKT